MEGISGGGRRGTCPPHFFSGASHGVSVVPACCGEVRGYVPVRCNAYDACGWVSSDESFRRDDYESRVCVKRGVSRLYSTELVEGSSTLSISTELKLPKRDDSKEG